MKASRYAWFNGCITDREAGAPSVASINFHLGTGVFDGLMAYWNKDHYCLWRAEDHLNRFRTGASKLGLDLPWSVGSLLEGIEALLAVEDIGTQYVRPIAYRREPELWVTGNYGRPVDVSIFTVRTERNCDDPITCHLSPVERISSLAIPGQTKVCGAYVNSFHARRTAEQAGFQDALLLDREGRVTEASAANFFAIQGTTLVTPPPNRDVFPGITRATVLQMAGTLGIDAVEKDLTIRDLRQIDGAFLASTLMELRPMVQLDDRALPSPELPIFRDILSCFRKETHR